MPAKSKNQKIAARIALAAKKGKIPKSKLKGASKSMSKMSTDDLEDFTEAEKLGVDIWYDRNTKSWVVQVKDQAGNQVGDATYVYTKEEALKAKKQIEKDMPRLAEADYMKKKLTKENKQYILKNHPSIARDLKDIRYVMESLYHATIQLQDKVELMGESNNNVFGNPSKYGPGKRLKKYKKLKSGSDTHLYEKEKYSRNQLDDLIDVLKQIAAHLHKASNVLGDEEDNT